MNERRPSYFDSGSQGRLSIRSSYSIDFQSINSFLQLVSTRETSDEPTRGEFSWAEIHRNEIHRRQNYPRKILRGKKKAPSTLVPRQGGEARSLNFIQPSSTTRVHREATQISFENRAACELARFGERETTKARTIINASNQAGVGEGGSRLFLAPAHVKDITYPPFLSPLFISVVAGYRRMVPRCPEIRETFGSRRLPPLSPLLPPSVSFPPSRIEAENNPARRFNTLNARTRSISCFPRNPA